MSRLVLTIPYHYGQLATSVAAVLGCLEVKNPLCDSRSFLAGASMTRRLRMLRSSVSILSVCIRAMYFTAPPWDFYCTVLCDSANE